MNNAVVTHIAECRGRVCHDSVREKLPGRQSNDTWACNNRDGQIRDEGQLHCGMGGRRPVHGRHGHAGTAIEKWNAGNKAGCWIETQFRWQTNGIESCLRTAASGLELKDEGGASPAR